MGLYLLHVIYEIAPGARLAESFAGRTELFKDFHDCHQMIILVDGRTQTTSRCWSFTISVSNTSTAAYEALYIDQSKLPMNLNSVPLYLGHRMLITETWLTCIGFWWRQSPWLVDHGHTKLLGWKEKDQVESYLPVIQRFSSTLSRSSYFRYCMYSYRRIICITYNRPSYLCALWKVKLKYRKEKRIEKR